MEYLYSKLGCSDDRGNHSLTLNCRFKTLKSMPALRYIIEFKTQTSDVLLSLIPGLFRQKIWK